MEVIFHRLIQKDLSSALAFYEAEGGRRLGDRFFAEAEMIISKVAQNPKRFHFIEEGLRRVAFNTFPYHFLYEETLLTVRFLVLRHDKRHPRFGLSRR